jgi:hypothetical protein
MERFVAADRLSLPGRFHHLLDHGHRVDATGAFYLAPRLRLVSFGEHLYGPARNCGALGVELDRQYGAACEAGGRHEPADRLGGNSGATAEQTTINADNDNSVRHGNEPLIPEIRNQPFGGTASRSRRLCAFYTTGSGCNG